LNPRRYRLLADEYPVIAHSLSRARANMQTPAVAAGPMPPGISTEVPGQNGIPFVRAAAPPRTAVHTITGPIALSGAQQPIMISMPGSGYMLWEDLFVQIVVSGTGNSSGTTVALAEDAPWAAIASVTLDDGGPQIINIDGYSLYLANIYGGTWHCKDYSLSSDVNVYSAQSTGTGTAAGTGQFRLRVPFAINERNYWGLLGNQDRATRYNLRTDIAGTGSIYTTAPTVLPTFQINRFYGWLPVPSNVSPDGRRQEQIPPWYGVIHYLTAVKSDALPTASSVVNHYIRNLSNAVRLFILVFRQGSGTTPRSSANSVLPTNIDFVLGTDVLWSESAAERRAIMWNRYGFDAPSGVLVYDMVHDFGMFAGTELGDHYVYLGNIAEAQFRCTYPSGYTANASNSLTIITDSLFIPPGIDIYGGSGL